YIAKSMFPKGTSTEPVKTNDGIKVTTDHGEELMADVVLFATGNTTSAKSFFSDEAKCYTIKHCKKHNYSFPSRCEWTIHVEPSVVLYC
ncbi:hypothetical protein Tco_0147009, partial [Tanacetum coccineum]